MLADWANEVETLFIKSCLEVLEFELGSTGSACPHGDMVLLKANVS